MNDRVLTPRLRTVTVGENTDKLTVRMVPGQAPKDWQQQADALAHAFGAEAARVYVVSPAVLGIDLRRVDALAEPIRIDTFRKPPSMSRTQHEHVRHHRTNRHATGAGNSRRPSCPPVRR